MHLTSHNNDETENDAIQLHSVNQTKNMAPNTKHMIVLLVDTNTTIDVKWQTFLNEKN